MTPSWQNSCYEAEQCVSNTNFSFYPPKINIIFIFFVRDMTNVSLTVILLTGSLYKIVTIFYTITVSSYFLSTPNYPDYFKKHNLGRIF